MITQTRLKELLHYDPDTGVFTWITVRSGQSSPGSIAGCDDEGKGKTYRVITVLGKSYPAHHLAWMYINGSLPDNELDHIDGFGTNNRIENLRPVTHIENHKNKRLYSTSTSGYSGVNWKKDQQRWTARIGVCGVRKHLGSYETIIDAVAARIRASKEYGFHENHGTYRPL